ncbi:hypothetical protein BDV33DRAFT_210873 [Aspergillus novoparasiticus]|uniref:Uncharacterized protein n=1 Tax=Aspergillus novoparasiticus TaxID=986946 RepID=A0A5N6E8P7_9EURO|nr:hypothetical protein BDV33DRAFT_210873 [Aspergillus novoparasiticus]
MSSSDDSLKELQDGIPIDPLILANDGPWEISDLHQPVLQDDSLIDSETICQYPEPPPILHHVPEHYRVFQRTASQPEWEYSNKGSLSRSRAHPESWTITPIL